MIKKHSSSSFFLLLLLFFFNITGHILHIPKEALNMPFVINQQEKSKSFVSPLNKRCIDPDDQHDKVTEPWPYKLKTMDSQASIKDSKASHQLEQ
jgi:hypothetical protein